ncbi:RdgB/HAM1 family non-canonical purine NTP pyrophosphatase [Desulfurispirillum indicum]|uniref:dITP/XTP pyrophosphatase n=1 Tax=Desulfurispirillum indicum (strain ATCC BAA-1389 / DSM 22839 / S5) TaxID=653733 RepID=E6W0W2_DESIS|nr:RdgB/HAM1 family non-canonical purine NTP pyrophosphatase [Desulfurispirillum indicum]ADU65294.1 non-canonical purine NTP pyrophosphatase, rdgB/HAM1 family [Desulfurispirillum indicum S5]UCZ57191.1 RdgB/HAM1 family non-canonical purine NTP pyrophosphatase [Desulfurispirillum indicum]
MKIILASKNRKKLIELREILRDIGVEVYSPEELEINIPDVEEDGSTFVENALKKARSAHLYSGLPAIADDSGICVDALGGAPGVYSARYAGDHCDDDDNNRKLLDALSEVEDRRGRFACAIAYVDDQQSHTVEGFCEGVVLRAPRGEGGFGYDPLFQPTGFEESFGSLPKEVKNRISHRYKAIVALKQFLQTVQQPV